MTAPPPGYTVELGVDAWGKHHEAVASGPDFTKHFRHHDAEVARAQAVQACWDARAELLRKLGTTQ